MCKEEELEIYHSGDTPPEGYYVCMKCSSEETVAIVPDITDKLPVCPVCNGDRWLKV